MEIIFTTCLPLFIFFASYLLFLAATYWGWTFYPVNVLFVGVLVCCAIYSIGYVLVSSTYRLPRYPRIAKILIFGVVVELFLFFIIAGIHSLKPIHLPQESDVLTYHLFLPLQHATYQSLKPLPWFWAEMFPMAVQWSMAPLFLVVWPPIKLSVYCFQLCIVGQVYLLSRLLGMSRLMSLVVVLWWSLTQAVYIQTGTAMFDQINVYFLTSAALLLVFGSKRAHHLPIWLKCNGVPLAFFLAAAYGVSSKNFSPVLFILFICPFILKFLKIKSVQKVPKPTLFACIALASIIVIPCWIRVWWYTGNPLYPLIKERWIFGPILPAHEFQMMFERLHVGRESFSGIDKTWANFFRSFLLLGFSGNGINGLFDYPAGIFPYMAIASISGCVVSTPTFFFGKFENQRFKFGCFLILTAFVIYVTWWFIGQQTRFLYPAFVLLFLGSMLILSSVNGRSKIVIILLFWTFANGWYPFLNKFREERSALFIFGERRIQDDRLRQALSIGSAERQKMPTLILAKGNDERNALFGFSKVLPFDSLSGVLKSGDQNSCAKMMESAKLNIENEGLVYGVQDGRFILLDRSILDNYFKTSLGCR